MKPHYYVYALNYGSPTVRHATLAKAQAEAERLAEKHPGRSFEILRSVGFAQTSKASTFWMDGEAPHEKPCYRMLNEGEECQHGDEFLSAETEEWKPVVPWRVGGEITKYHRPYRRPL